MAKKFNDINSGKTITLNGSSYSSDTNTDTYTYSSSTYTYSSGTSNQNYLSGTSVSTFGSQSISKEELKNIVKEELKNMLPEIVDLLKNSINYTNKTTEKFKKTKIEFYDDDELYKTFVDKYFLDY